MHGAFQIPPALILPWLRNKSCMECHPMFSYNVIQRKGDIYNTIYNTTYNTIKDPQWYVVQGSDTTMIHKAASLFGQRCIKKLLIHYSLAYTGNPTILINPIKNEL